MYWKIGNLINEEILHFERADYGEQIVATLSHRLSWSHFVELVELKDEPKRNFYVQMCIMENCPIGLILCADAKNEHIELLRLEDSNIKVASYLTSLPPKSLLQEKLQLAILIARMRLEQKTDGVTNNGFASVL